ncbi:MAG TPA: ATP-binding protein [Pyrinomonadaceae bacterium]|nr:ATP-binding protein [Pyrinomonadaceae bacterium]
MASQNLGYRKLGRQIRSRLNKTLYAEVRRGRFCIDGADNVTRREWRNDNEVATRIVVPTIGEGLAFSRQLCALWNQVACGGPLIEFDFSTCSFLSQQGVAFLGGLARLSEHSGREVRFIWNSLQQAIKMNLQQNGFCSTFGWGTGPWQGNSIPYREDAFLDKDALVNYLADRWLGRDWVHLSEGLRNAVASKASEIYINAFEHSRSPVGIFSCGQHYPKRRMVSLSAVDFGVGIPHKVRSYKATPTISADKAMEWAFQRGTTTRKTGAGGGLGLDLLKQLVTVNGGSLTVFSHDGCAVILNSAERYHTREPHFGGTMITITLRCDAAYYRLMDESANEPLF